MLSAALVARLDALLDELIADGGVEAASLASVLLAAKDSLQGDGLVSFSRKVWAANNAPDLAEDAPPRRENPAAQCRTLTP